MKKKALTLKSNPRWDEAPIPQPSKTNFLQVLVNAGEFYKEENYLKAFQQFTELSQNPTAPAELKLRALDDLYGMIPRTKQALVKSMENP